MNILNTAIRFTNALLPITKKSYVVKEAEDLYKGLYDVSLDVFTKMEDTVGARSNITKTLESRLRNVKGYQGNSKLVSGIRELTVKVLDNKDKMISRIDDHFNDKISKEGLDAAGTVLLQYVEALGFYSTYTRHLAVALVSEERLAMKKSLSKYDHNSLNFVYKKEHINFFVVVAEALSSEYKDIGKKLDKIEGVRIPKDTYTGALGFSERELNPLRTGFDIVSWSPALFFGKLWNDLVDYRYQEARIQKQKIQFELIALENEKTQNLSEKELASIENQIAYHNRRLQKLNARIKSIEESVGE